MSIRPNRRRYWTWVLGACLGSSGAAGLFAGQPDGNTAAKPSPPVVYVGSVAPTLVAAQDKAKPPPPGPATPPRKGLPTEAPAPLTPGAAAAMQDIARLAKLLGDQEALVDLPSALRAAGINNPDIQLARQRVVEAMALRQYAAAQLLPSVHLGASYDNHNGTLQQSDGNILKVDRSDVFFGAGANAIAAGTVNIPGVFWMGNVSEGVFGALIARQVVEARRFASRAVENEMLLRVGVAYTELLRSEGRFAVARSIFEDARKAEFETAIFYKAGAGSKADADRARAERGQRQAQLFVTEGDILLASDRLAELLNLPPTTRLRAVDDKVIPCQLVPDNTPLPQLLAIAMMNRPELQERRAVIRQALLALERDKLLPFSPSLILGLSYGGFGGGSNLVAQPPGTTPFPAGQSRFGHVGERMDVDAVFFWTAENMGLGNWARIRLSNARLGTAQLQLLEQLNTVRAQVANAYNRAHARYAQIAAAEPAVRDAISTFSADLLAVKNGEGTPIELLEALRLLARARYAYLDAIVNYNEAQLQLYVALGQPPADSLAHPVPTQTPTPAYQQPPPVRGQQPPAQKKQ